MSHWAQRPAGQTSGLCRWSLGCGEGYVIQKPLSVNEMRGKTDDGAITSFAACLQGKEHEVHNANRFPCAGTIYLKSAVGEVSTRPKSSWTADALGRATLESYFPKREPRQKWQPAAYVARSSLHASCAPRAGPSVATQDAQQVHAIWRW